MAPPQSPRDSPATDADLVRLYLAGRDIACHRCGYNLRGLGGDCCPECGQQFVPMILPAYIDVPTRPLEPPEVRAGRLRDYLADRDVPCPNCGGNLRGVGTVACPACQHPLDLWALRSPGLDLARTGRRSGLLILGALVGGLVVTMLFLVYLTNMFGGP